MQETWLDALYTYTYNMVFDPIPWAMTAGGERPSVVARRRFDITIANVDAAASPLTDAAILEVHRAVHELLTLPRNSSSP